ncbi:MAG TPA: hypothetical protein DCE65_07550 [Clostridiales bacterium]|nr:hypothetical protein [Clostridiales bacterium]
MRATKKLFFLASGAVFSFTFSAFYCKIERRSAPRKAEAFFRIAFLRGAKTKKSALRRAVRRAGKT